MKKLILTSAIALAGVSTISHAAPQTYEVEPSHFFIQFKVPHLGFSYVIGTFNDISGTYDYDSETGAISNVDVSVNTESLDSDHGERNKHLRSGDFLDVSNHPTATFKSTAWQDGKLTGELTIHGETQEVTIPVTKMGEGEDPWGKYRSGFESNFTVNFADFGIPDKMAQAAEIYVTGEGVRQ
ncbi:YceI family protein [Suttonella sp. R2A3]|uniref:YceI family protein n=1 Tax=Suttonella sp. R2A3 TaxID=2908648 RepID=UPI001F1B7170|nr:YceI family protein [Suttonella sp. R2A3]UJF23837.1 YceI family protein [Suttonella sp. R2A3]